jgi:hypothetical protein
MENNIGTRVERREKPSDLLTPYPEIAISRTPGGIVKRITSIRRPTIDGSTMLHVVTTKYYMIS